MYTQRPKLFMDIGTQEYKDFLACCAQEVLFLYFFELISFVNSNKICKDVDLDNAKNNLLNNIIGLYIEQVNLQNADFLNIKNFILDYDFGESSNQGDGTQKELFDLLGEQKLIIQKLDSKMKYLKDVLLEMKHIVIKADSNGIDFDKIFSRVVDEFIYPFFSDEGYEYIYKDNIIKRLKALMRSFYLGATLFEYYFKDYSSVYIKSQITA